MRGARTRDSVISGRARGTTELMNSRLFASNRDQLSGRDILVQPRHLQIARVTETKIRIQFVKEKREQKSGVARRNDA